MTVHYIILFLLFPAIGFSQSKIEGRLTDATTTKPLTGTRVSLLVYAFDSSLANNPYHQEEVSHGLAKPNARDTIYRRINTVYTDSLGYYQFENVDPQIYKLSVFHKTAQEDNRQYGEFDEKKGIVVGCDALVKQDFQLAVYCPFDSTKT